MAYTDFYPNFELFLRWLHVIAGITWIGHLYFFNFVNVPLQGSIDDATKKAVNPQLQPRALWWFRWGAMITFLSGLILFTMIYMHSQDAGFGPTIVFSGGQHGMSGRAIWILMGMLLATIMWFNVWFIIWPAQKRILGIIKVAPEELPPIRKRALLASRTNTYLSGPMLFGMLAANHYSAVNKTTILVYIAIGAAAIWVAIFHSYKVGKLSS